MTGGILTTDEKGTAAYSDNVSEPSYDDDGSELPTEEEKLKLRHVPYCSYYYSTCDRELIRLQLSLREHSSSRSSSFPSASATMA